MTVFSTGTNVPKLRDSKDMLEGEEVNNLTGATIRYFLSQFRKKF